MAYRLQNNINYILILNYFIIKEIMEVEHLWQYNENETPSIRTNSSNQDFVANLCNIADHRLYKIVKWCKSLPLFKNISVCIEFSTIIIFKFRFLFAWH